MNNLESISTCLADQNLKLENFFSQNQTSFSDLGGKLKSGLEDIMCLKNDIDKTIQDIEMEIQRNQNLLTKLVSSANTKLVQEQIVQKRKVLTDQTQKINDVFTQISQEIDKVLNDFGTSSQELVANFKNTENQVKSLTGTKKTSETNPTASLNNGIYEIQQSIKQAVDALNAVQLGKEQQKVLTDMNKSIDNLLQ